LRWIIEWLWLIPALPLAGAGFIALLPRRRRSLGAALAILPVVGSLCLSAAAFAASLRGAHGVHNVKWFEAGGGWVELGWVLNPLTSVMLVMVSLISLLIFIYSVGYMREDRNFTRFFCFLAFFSAAMLGVVISNSLLLLFICWELVGLASYLLIGFWYHKPAAATAAKKAFIVTRIGDLCFLAGMVVLYSKTGTLLLYNSGDGFLEGKALAALAAQSVGPFALTTLIALLVFAGAAGKSGQIPLHVWLPDAMEGPTPVSALIHAATMVAAGVFLVARVYPLMAVEPALHAVAPLPQIQSADRHTQAVAYSAEEPRFSRTTTALRVVAWTGVLTALMAAGIAVRQNDIKRILAYSTVSQLGFMMAGLGMGGVAVGMFHLMTHAFFKALLFLGAGSVIHGCHEEQDIRRMGGLRKAMPVTFVTYAVGMLALSGFPLLFSGFWSKDAILHASHGWGGGALPFYLLLLAALLTAFYMTRQMCHVFCGASRPETRAHESPPVMLFPLVLLAGMAVLLSLVGTPAWPWFEAFLAGASPTFQPENLAARGTVTVMVVSSIVALAGIGLGTMVFRKAPSDADEMLERKLPETARALSGALHVDRIYDGSVVAAARWLSRAADWLDRTIISGVVEVISLVSVGAAWLSRFADEYLVNRGFDEGCSGLREGGRFFHGWQRGNAQTYLRISAAGVVLIALMLLWGCR
jgi:NADH-quinone oxidoreductase subunit L